MLLVGASALGAAAPASGEPPPPAEQAAPALDECTAELERLRAAAGSAELAQADETLKKQVELQQKQIQLLEKMIRLLADESRTQAATADARARQAAQRDRELADAVDNIVEHADAVERRGPALPPTLRELFLPTRTNESPIGFYGTLAADFVDFQEQPSNFPSPVFSPHFYMLLNEEFLFEINPEIRANGINLESAQVDWFVGDHLTVVFGRFYSPLGFFNERLHTSWIFKTPDRPLMFQQVYPAPLSFTGVQARGAAYPTELPVKLEYSAFVADGFSLDARNPTARDFADLRPTRDPFDDVNNDKAFGGRIGLSFPELGVIVGVSGLANGAYDRAGEHDLSLWDVDFSYHCGNWDFRFEYARTHQQAPGMPIDRQGLYAQVAYRPYDSLDPILQKLEGIFRYDYVEFRGIDLAATGLNFGPRERIPIDRGRYTVGLNCYPYPSLVFKVAYQFSDELSFRDIRDHGFLAQVAWGF